MKTTIAGLIPNTPIFAYLGSLCLAVVCLSSSAVNAAVDDWPATEFYSPEAKSLEQFVSSKEIAMALTCRPSVQVSLDMYGQATITPGMLVIAPDFPLDQYTVDIMGPLLDVVTCDEIGDEIMAMVEDPLGNFCMSSITVEDKLKPQLTCVDDTIPCNTDLLALDYEEFVIVHDNCDEDPDLYYEFAIVELDCDPDGFAGYVELTYTATDDYGNSRSCNKRIWLEKYGLEDVDFPADTMIDCENPDYDPEITGVPTIEGQPIHHFCELVAWHSDNVIPMCSGQTKIIRLWRVMDWCTGEQISDPQEILIIDTVPPEIECPDDLTLGTSMLVCSANYVLPDLDVSDVCSDDNLIYVRYSISTIPGIFFPGNQVTLGLGDHVITFRATDDCNNTSTCSFVVTVVDDDDPMVACNNINISLNESGMAFLDANSPAFSASDNCGVVSRLIRRMDDACDTPENLIFGPSVKFCCEDVGDTVMVIFQAMDAAGNISTCMVGVAVKDPIDPVAECKAACVLLGADGTGSITVDSVDNGSYDNCGIVNRFVSDSLFNCDDIGVQVVVLTVEDEQGNTASCTANVTVKDSFPPVALCRDITVELNDMGMVTISTGMIDNGSSDNCELDTLFLSRYDFDCDDIGDNIVTLTVVDTYGNTSTCTATVTVEEMPPMVMCMDVTVFLDENGMVTITPDDVDGVTDDCSVPDREVIPSMFDCDDIGPNVVTLIATDGSGNTATCTATVTVVDNMDPECMAMDITVQLDEDGEVMIAGNAVNDGSTDNCEIVSITVTPNSFDCEDTDGPVLVVQTVTDQSGNSATCTAFVTVEDNLDPICMAQNLIVQLDENGMVTISDDALDDGSTDNCGIEDITISQNAFDCDDVGDEIIVIQTVTDVNGNASTCTGVVTTEDNIPPDCSAQDITVFLDAAGGVGIIPDQVNDGSSDACGIDEITVFPNQFDCEDVEAPVIVTLTVTDVNGNVSTCTAFVTVFDTISPVCMTMDITVELGPDGTVTIDSNAVDNGSTDNCEIVEITVTPDLFDCESDGVVVVVQTVTDASGNTSTCSANVTVEGGGEPEAFCQDITVFLDEEGGVTIDPEDVDDGSFSLCGDIELEVNPFEFDCGDVNAFPVVILTVTDAVGNTATCSATVTVLDTVAPTCQTQDITVFLDDAGSVGIEPNDIDNGSDDACGIEEITVTPNQFDCEDVGAPIVVTLTVTDVNDNTSTCTAFVTVMDTIAPICMTQDITVEILGTMVTITADQIDDGSSDNCGGVTLAVEPNSFDCDDVDIPQVVVLTVTDDSGNMTTCTATVTVEDPGILEASCQNLTVFLNANGMVVVDPEDVDNGSGGGCAAGQLEFDLSQEIFDCTDVGVNSVTLTVTDSQGNTATCTALITVIDNLPPSLVCPPDMTADCDDPIDIEDLSQFGNPTTGDNCPPVILEETVEDDRNDCGAGTITRTFLATDPSGNTSQCVQVITIGDSDPFGEDDIIWPPMIVNLGQCSSTDPGPGNQPIIDAGDCSIISVDFDDEVTMTVDNDPNTPCIEIERTWTVIDSCQLEMGTQNGIFTFTQMITLNDNVGPIFSPILNDITVDADTVTCTAFVSLVTSATDCGMATPVINSFNDNGGDASGEYPIGTTIVIFSSTDDCGNISTMDVVVTVVDPDSATIMCEKIIRHMNEELEVPVLAEEFITFTPGSCTSIDDFLFSYSPTNPLDSFRLWGCQYAGSVEPVMIYTFNLDGTPYDTCRADLDFRDTMDLCGNGFTLTGEIYGEMIRMIDEVAVLISEPSMTTAFTNDKGRYVYRELAEGSSYVITPYKNTNHKEGVTTLDLLAIHKYLLGLHEFSSPYTLIAADANNSGHVTALDLVEIRKLLLGVITQYTQNTSWRFIASNFEFPDPQNPWAIPFQETILFDSVNQHYTHQDFIGVKVGDVNNTAFHLQDEEDIDVRSESPLVLHVEDKVVNAGEHFDIPIRVSGYEDVLGYQFALNYNTAILEFGGVSIPKGSFLNEDWFGVADDGSGIISNLWYEAAHRDVADGELLFTLQFTANRTAKLSELIGLDAEALSPQAYHEEFRTPSAVRLVVGGAIAGAEFEVFQNLPNPFAEGTIIPVQVPEATTVSLEIFSSDGRLVYAERREVNTGYYEFQISAEQLEHSGVYYYTVSTDRFRGTRKMILLD